MSKLSRRDFVKTTAAAVGASSTLGAMPSFAWAEGSDVIPVGLIGCGGRGTGAASDIVVADAGIEIVAMGDLFQDRLDKARAQLAEKIGPKLRLEDRVFVGFDAYRQVIQSGAPRDSRDAARLPAGALRRRGRGRKACVHGKARGG